MLKEKKELENIAIHCIDSSIKNAATNCEVKVKNIISETVNLRNKKIENSDRSDILSVYITTCLLYTSPSPRDGLLSRMPSSA